MGRKHKKGRKEKSAIHQNGKVGVNPPTSTSENMLQNTNSDGGSSSLWKTIEIFATIILAAFAGIFGFSEHTILAIIFLLAAVIFGLVLIAKAIAAKQNKLAIWMICSVICIVLSIGASFWLYNLWNSEDRFTGPLTPANDPFPQISDELFSPTNFPPSSIFIFAGGGMYVTDKNLPFTLIRAGGISTGKDLITLQWIKSGAAISGEFFGKNGDIVAVIETNNFVVNKLNYLTKETPDRHTLIVRDQQNVEVLNLRYLNPRAFSLTGTIRLPNLEDVTITKTNIQRGRMKISGGGSIYSRVAFVFSY
jgi:hypothetical protein